MRFYLSCLLAMAFAFSSTGQSELLENKISLTTAGWPGLGMLFLLDTGINYDRLLTKDWALFASARYEFSGHMHGLYQGGVIEGGAKFMFWSHGQRAFTKGVVAALGTGFGYGATSRSNDPNPQPIIEQRLWMPFTVAAHYMYTWDNNVFITAGLKSQIFKFGFLKELSSTPTRAWNFQLGMRFR